MAQQNGSTSSRALQAMAANQLGAVSSRIQEYVQQSGAANDELAGGITSGFAVVSVRGKVFRVKHRGEERPLLNDQGDPRASIEVVIVKASSAIAKIFYLSGYVEGSNAPPDCWSVDGRVPDAASPQRQSNTCAGCPHNAWGSGANGKGKACADSKRLAILPLEDLDNEFFGGPMLLRVPPASLSEVKTFTDKLNQIGYPYFGVAARVRLDPNAEYPRLTFGAIRVLTDEEADKVIAWREDPVTERILATPVEHVETAGEDLSHTQVFEQPPQQATQKPVQQPQQRPANVQPLRPQQPVQQAPAPVQAGPAPVPAPVDDEDGDGVPDHPTPQALSEHRVEEVQQQTKKNSFAGGFAGTPQGNPVPAAAPVQQPQAAPKAAPKPRAAKAAPAQPQEQVFEQPAAHANGAAGEPVAGGLPGDFDSMLDGMLGG